MWIDVKTLAAAVGLTTRAVQIRLKDDASITTRMNGKKKEAYIPSLPSEWQAALVHAGEYKEGANALQPVSPKDWAIRSNEKALAAAANILGRKPTDSDLEKIKIMNLLKEHADKKGKYALVATYMGCSESKIRRIEKEVKACSVIGHATSSKGRSSFDPEAERYLKGYYLQVLQETGTDSKKTAWTACQLMAKQKGWNIGGRSTAYTILSEIQPLLITYAREGNRGLDNIFYISRDCLALRPFQVIIGDQHIFDWWIADYDKGTIRRPECYLWLDMGTKLVYGIAFADNHYDSETVKEALRFGLYRHGPFENTYNDNGTSECSKVINEIVGDLQRMHMDMKDITDLYQMKDGSYAVLDDEGNVEISAPNKDKFRRVFAQVRNAKAKDIERFFRTLESRLSQRCLPGAVENPAANAAEDEVYAARLKRQKDKHELLTIEQFARVVCEELAAYEDTVHGSLHGMTPKEALKKKQAEGWKQRKIDLNLVDFILFERRPCKVSDGRVLLNGKYYIGAAQTTSQGKLDDVGLWRYEGQKVEIRWSRYNTDFCIASLPGTANPIRLLLPVAKNIMFDDIALKEQMAEKRRQMKAVRESFGNLTALIPDVTYRPPEMLVDVTPEDIDQRDKATPEKKPKKMDIPFISLSDKATPRKRYQWCLKMLVDGHDLSEDDKSFMRNYKTTKEYEENQARWNLMESKIDKEKII